MDQFLPVDRDAYDAASHEVMTALRRLPDVIVEVLGWDECFLGATISDPEALAHRAQEAVLSATRLHCTVGIGDNKVRAKIATEFGKPRGIFRTAENWFDVGSGPPARCGAWARAWRSVSPRSASTRWPSSHGAIPRGS